MILNPKTFTQYSPYDSIDVLLHGHEEATITRIELARDVVMGVDPRGWSDRFFLLKGHAGQWGGDVFKCLHLMRPDLENEAFHTGFSHAVAEACFRRSQSRHLILVSAMKSWDDLSEIYLRQPESSSLMLDRVLERMNNHPSYHAPDLEFLFIPSPSEYRDLRAERHNTNHAPLMAWLAGNEKLFGCFFQRLKGKRLAWAVENVPAVAIDAYFERHPDSDKLATRLEIELGL
jgi:hypothetical protein